MKSDLYGQIFSTRIGAKDTEVEVETYERRARSRPSHSTPRRPAVAAIGLIIVTTRSRPTTRRTWRL